MACDGKIQNREGKWKKKCVALLWDLRSWLVDKWESIDSIHKHIFLFTYILQHTHSVFRRKMRQRSHKKGYIDRRFYRVPKQQIGMYSLYALCTNPLYSYFMQKKQHTQTHAYTATKKQKHTHTPRRYGTRITHRITFMKHFNAHSPSFAHSTRDPDRTKIVWRYRRMLFVCMCLVYACGCVEFLFFLFFFIFTPEFQ